MSDAEQTLFALIGALSEVAGAYARCADERGQTVAAFPAGETAGAPGTYIARDVFLCGARAGAVEVGPVDGLPPGRVRALEAIVRAAACQIEQEGLLRKPFDLFSDLYRYVDEHLTEDMSARALCAALYVSGSTLSRVIRQRTGLSLKLFIRARRLDAAKGLLLSTSLPIMQVAGQCGISDFNYFSRVFKRRFGVSPSAMRKANADKTDK